MARRRRISDQQPLMSNVNIMLLGSTQAGKSASGNTIIGDRSQFTERASSEAVTRYFNSAHTEVDGQTITVIDTVGLSDTLSMKIRDAQTQIEQVIQNYNIDVFLLVFRLGETFTKEKAATVNWIKENFGEKVVHHTIVLFTHGDEISVSIEEYLRECNALQSVVDQFSGIFHVFNNRTEDRAQVTELLEKIYRLMSVNRYYRYSKRDYAEAQRDILQEKCLTGTAIGAGVGGVGVAVGGAIAAKAGAVALTVGKAAVVGATGGALLFGAAACAGVYFLARKYNSR